MKIFAVFLPMLDEEKSKQYRPQHLAYLADMHKQGKVITYGRFVDGAGGLVIYKADTLKTVQSYVNDDPYIIHKARTYEIHEWDIVTREEVLNK